MAVTYWKRQVLSSQPNPWPTDLSQTVINLKPNQSKHWPLTLSLISPTKSRKWIWLASLLISWPANKSNKSLSWSKVTPSQVTDYSSMAVVASLRRNILTRLDTEHHSQMHWLPMIKSLGSSKASCQDTWMQLKMQFKDLPISLHSVDEI